MTKRTVHPYSADTPPNPAAAARQRLNSAPFTPWSWERDGDDIAGTFLGTRTMPDKYRKSENVAALEVEEIDSGRRVLVYASPGLQRIVESHKPSAGDGIAIRRGEMIERNDGPAFRSWQVEVVHADRGAA
jgi:hypothetical protein